MKLLFVLLVSGLFFYSCERPTEINNGDDGIPPGVPEGLRIYYASDGEIIIDWIYSREPDISHYNIHKSIDSLNYYLIDSINSEFYIDDSLDYDTLYFYKISAVDFSGNESDLTNAVSAIPKNMFPPLRPLELEINARNWNGKKSIFLNWFQNAESDLKGYKIYRSDISGFNADTSYYIGTSLSNSFEDTIVTDFYKNYYYRVKAFDKGNLESSASVEISDMIFEEPQLIIPANNSVVSNFRKFLFLSTGAPANYKIIVQTNLFFGEVWQADISSSAIYDTIEVNVPSGVFFYGTSYYWRVAAYSSGSLPNSITPLNKFEIKP